MDKVTRDKIYHTHNQRETADLLAIWQEHDLEVWQEETFEIIKEILVERLGTVPPYSIKHQVEAILKRDESDWEPGELDKVLSACNSAIALAPDQAAGYYYRGMILEEMGKPDQAVIDYQEAIRLDPGWQDAWDNLESVEEVLTAEFLHSAAKQHLDQALDYFHNDELPRALDECELARQTLPHIALAYNYMGLVFEELGQLKSAIAAYLKSTWLNPRFSAARQNLRNARVKLEEDHYHQAALENGEELQEEGSPLDGNEIIADFGKSPELPLPEGVDPAPGWLYLDEAGFVMPGWPGHRNRPGRIGLDYLDTSFEEAHMEGVMIRMLLMRRLRTHNLFYLAGMTLLGFLFCLPLVFGGMSLIQGRLVFHYSAFHLHSNINCRSCVVGQRFSEPGGGDAI